MNAFPNAQTARLPSTVSALFATQTALPAKEALLDALLAQMGCTSISQNATQAVQTVALSLVSVPALTATLLVQLALRLIHASLVLKVFSSTMESASNALLAM